MNIDESIAIKKITLYFTILGALFLMLSSQFTGFILPLLFIIPIYMGLIGIKARRKSGYLIGMAIIPLAFAISVMWIRYSIVVFSDMNNQIAQMSTQYGISVLTMQIMTIGFFLLSIVMITLAVLLFIKLRRNKEIFT
ncbi:hypothetical protein LGK97_09780 [Clostridium sp. CS001]|uniref:hypothetical protein n=1 Tax=Clostridium sp. CS001 TaxID=2880648 RepID=UPI001CF4E1DD|nr:hypothetical protein [Clostridium sp. CS001]MCB2290056.1 hypothetical protein [Clostridium sp. CS001]